MYFWQRYCSLQITLITLIAVPRIAAQNSDNNVRSTSY